jgi:hypothetical protein
MIAQRKNWPVLTTIAAVALAISIAGDQYGIPQKWNVGLGTTFLVFGIVIKQFPSDWKRPLFWLVICVLLPLHLGVLWLILSVVLSRATRVGTLAWSPLAFAQGVILFLLVSFAKQKFFREIGDRRK